MYELRSLLGTNTHKSTHTYVHITKRKYHGSRFCCQRYSHCLRSVFPRLFYLFIVCFLLPAPAKSWKTRTQLFASLAIFLVWRAELLPTGTTAFIQPNSETRMWIPILLHIRGCAHTYLHIHMYHIYVCKTKRCVFSYINLVPSTFVLDKFLELMCRVTQMMSSIFW